MTRPTITLGRGAPSPDRAAPSGDTAVEPIVDRHLAPASAVPPVDPTTQSAPFAAPSPASSTMASTTVASPSPVGDTAAPEAVPAPADAPSAPMSMPSLPSVTAAAVPVVGAPTGAHATGMTSQQMAAVQSGVYSSAPATRSDGHRVARTIMFMVLAVALAAGGRYALDWYERTEVAEDAAAALGATAELDVGTVDPPDLQVVELEVMVADGDLVVGAASQVQLRDGAQVVDITVSQPFDGVSALSLDVRGDRIVGRVGPADPWTALPPETVVGFEPFFDNLDLPWMLTLSDLVPPESLPFVTVVERTEEVLDHPPLVAVPGAAATPAVTTTDVRRFVVRRDHEAFRIAEPVAYGQLPRHGRWEVEGEVVDQLEIWVDDANVVRRLHLVEREGETVTFSWTAGNRSSSGFPAAPPLLTLPPVTEGG